VPRPLWRRADVDDLVQLTFLRALRRYCDFEMRTSAEFQHYLRRILLNLTRDEIRSARRAPESVELGDIAVDRTPSSLDVMLGREASRRFREAVRTLPERSRFALLARLERGLSYEEIARLISAPGPAASRAVVARSVQRVAKAMKMSANRRASRKKAR
jgi:RNA polymerase sigma-70 factor (ECF subfamily)